MRFAVVQTTLKIPGIRSLQRAFHGCPGLARADGMLLARDAFGILVKNFPREDALLVKKRLAAEGIESEVVPERELPVLPPVKMIRRLDCTPDKLLIYDPLSRAIPLAFADVLMVAAGKVPFIEHSRNRTSRLAFESRSGIGPDDANVVIEYRSKEEQKVHLVLEIVVKRCALRFRAQAGNLQFESLGKRKTNNLERNFQLLLEDLFRSVPGALRNRGAHYLEQKNPEQSEVFLYPSKNAFYEEIIWLLWRSQRGGGAVEGKA